MVDEELVPKQKTDHTPPVDMRAPFVALFRAMLRKTLKQRQINVRIVQLLEQPLDGRRARYNEALKWSRKARFLLSPNDLLWQ